MDTPPGSLPSQPHLWRLLGIVTLAFTAVLLGLSFQFVHGVGHAERPILIVVMALLAWGILYAALSMQAFRSPPRPQLVWVVAVAARLLLLASNPIQEDDIYRYLWDGRVLQAGVDPYLFSPVEVEGFEAGGEALLPGHVAQLARLVALKKCSPALDEIFGRINNRQYATIYPAGAQMVFRAHSTLVPVEWSVATQVGAMKAILGLFDLATIAILMFLLSRSGLNPGLSVLYAWCPLVLKEFSNSGHMDSVPTFFLVATLAAQARGWPLVCGLCLGAATGTKLFAVIVLPIVFRSWSLKRGGIFLLGFALVALSALLAFPVGAARRQETLLAFAQNWEMNDAIFPWIDRGFQLLGSPWFTAHAAVGLLVLAVVFVHAARTRRETRPPELARSAFAVLALLFLAGPLGFPWYFTWCLPLLPFVRKRAWLLAPGILSIYYVRFWLDYRYPGSCLGFESGRTFFDEVVVPVEVGVLFLALVSGSTLRRAVISRLGARWFSESFAPGVRGDR